MPSPDLPDWTVQPDTSLMSRWADGDGRPHGLHITQQPDGSWSWETGESTVPGTSFRGFSEAADAMMNAEAHAQGRRWVSLPRSSGGPGNVVRVLEPQ